MGRILWAGLFACIALGFVVAPVSAEDTQSELEKLRQEVDGLKATMLEQDINTYLSETEGVAGAQGGGSLQGVTIHARFTSVFLGTLGQSDPAQDIGVVDGDVDLDFDFQVTDNLVLFIHTTANNGGRGGLPFNFPATGITGFGGATLSGLLDGIGVDGTRPVKNGSIITREVGIRTSTPISNGEFHWEMGELDPRHRFLQNAFANDENTQFMNNLFDDSPSVPWLTDSTGRVSLGWHLWFDLGANKEHTINFGWFNTPGQWFANGQLYVQYSWTGEVKGRAMHIRAMGFYSKFPAFGGGPTPTKDESIGGGVTWDWMATDKVGVFVTLVANNKNLLVPSTFDGTFGAVWHGLGSRADDKLGVAIGFISPNKDVLPGASTEFTVEVYYVYSTQDGKLQVTPFLQYINKPGGGSSTGIFTDSSSLFMLGLRIHVPF